MPIKEISEVMVKSYEDNMRLEFQQKTGRIWMLYDQEPNVVGKEHYFDFDGKSEAVTKTTRHSDTPIIDNDNIRTRCSLIDADWATLIDKEDELKVLGNPKSRKIQTGVSAIHRKMDAIAIAALGATAYRGENGTDAVNYLAAQQIVHGGTGLDFAKIRKAKDKMDAAEVPEEDRFFIVGSYQLNRDILSDDQLKSKDYEALRALVEGKSDKFLNFTFIRSELLPKVSTTRSCYAFQKMAMGFASAGGGIQSSLTIRNDKRMAAQPYSSISCGAARIQDTGVVEVQCTES